MNMAEHNLIYRGFKVRLDEPVDNIPIGFSCNFSLETMEGKLSHGEKCGYADDRETAIRLALCLALQSVDRYLRSGSFYRG